MLFKGCSVVAMALPYPHLGRRSWMTALVNVCRGSNVGLLLIRSLLRRSRKGTRVCAIRWQFWTLCMPPVTACNHEAKLVVQRLRNSDTELAPTRRLDLLSVYSRCKPGAVGGRARECSIGAAERRWLVSHIKAAESPDTCGPSMR
jgi:hypothetical protein